MKGELDRQGTIKRAEREDELSDLKQHADKIIRGFESFTEYSANRAIWELMQNACDLTEECQVTIDYSGEGISFSHNGRPFNTKSLISLIKQVSSKAGDSFITEVGKFGTGFLVTHSFGRLFKVNSLLEIDGEFIRIEDFVIDRSEREWEPLAISIKKQKDKVYHLLEHSETIPKPELHSTIFTFIPKTDQEKLAIEKSKDGLLDYLKNVLVFNDRLRSVKVVYSSDHRQSFHRTEKVLIKSSSDYDLYRTIISTDNNTLTICSIRYEDEGLEIILPLKQSYAYELPSTMARLYVSFPLVGSEDFGLNLLINCEKFSPTEPRDGIHLKSNKDQLSEDEQGNRELIHRVSQIVFSYLQDAVGEIDNAHFLARVGFQKGLENNRILSDYLSELQCQWSEMFRNMPLVPTSQGIVPPTKLYFFDDNLLAEENAKLFDAIYELSDQLGFNLPVKEIAQIWSKYVIEWDNPEVLFIHHHDLLEKIGLKSLDFFDQSTLIVYYQSLVSSGDRDFYEYAKIPNRNGSFKHRESLMHAENLTPELMHLGEILIPDKMKQLVHEEFVFGFNWTRFGRRDYSKEVKVVLEEIDAVKKYYLNPELKYSKQQEEALCLGKEFVEAFITYCRLNTNTDSTSKPVKLVRLISQYYGTRDDLISLPDLPDDRENLDHRSERKTLVRLFFNTLELSPSEWVESNLELLKLVQECNEDSFKEAFSNAAIIPTQLNELKTVTELKRVGALSDHIINLYKEIVEIDIKSSVSYEEFNDFLAEDDPVCDDDLAHEIERTLFTNGEININEHQKKDQIIDIIKLLHDPTYQTLFKGLNQIKANLMLDLVTNEETKDDLFSIVTLHPDQLSRIGSLIKKKNFEQILNRAEEEIRLEAERKSDFRHKYEIGRRIEARIRESLSDFLNERVEIRQESTIETVDEQAGQDIVIYLDDEPIYFIEVKSRWNDKNSITMSKLQLSTAVEKGQSYALCAVDVTKYEGNEDRYNLPMEVIQVLTRFVRNIGKEVAPLVNPNIKAETIDADIHLIDYRGVIKQNVFKEADKFDVFVSFLIQEINRKVI